MLLRVSGGNSLISISIGMLFLIRLFYLVVAKEDQEAAEAEQAISEMARKKQCKEEQRTHLLAQIEETREAIRKKRKSTQPSFHKPVLFPRLLTSTSSESC